MKSKQTLSEPIENLKLGDIITEQVMEFYKYKDHVRFYFGERHIHNLPFNPFRFNVQFDECTKTVLLIWKG